MIIDFSNVNGGGGGSGYTLPIASQSTLGGIKVGQNLTIDSGGTLSADAQAVSVATTATTGVVQVGSGLSITSGGVLSTDIDLSDYAEKSDLEDYATTDSLSAYTPQSAMSEYLTTREYSYDVDDVLENNIKTLYGDDGAVGMAYLWNDGGIDKAKVFKVTDTGTSVDDYTYIQPSKNTKAFVGWSMDKSEQIATIDVDNWDNPTIALKSDVAKFGYVDEKNGVANFIVANEDGFFTQEWSNERDEWVAGELQPIGGGEEIGKATTYDWGTVQLGNGIGLEVNDNVIFGVSAGENYVFGNGEGVGYDPNNSKGGGMKAPLPSAYTQYNLDVYDDYDNCIYFVDGVGNISLSLFIDGQDGNVVRFDCDGTRYIKIYCSSGVYYLEASAENKRGAKSAIPTTATTIEFRTSSPYKDFMIQYNGSGNIEVYESYDNYDTPIAELSDVDFGETISHIQLFDSSTSMNETGIGTISINNTDYIKPYYEYDGNTVSKVGFVLRKRSYIDSSF